MGMGKQKETNLRKNRRTAGRKLHSTGSESGSKKRNTVAGSDKNNNASGIIHEMPGANINEWLGRQGKSEMPSDIKPMLATLVNEPFHEEGWLYEVKWDGFRALAYKKDGEIELRSRNNKSFNEKFYPVFNALKAWEVNAVIDGEIVALNSEGLPDFAALQTWRSEADGELVYYVFDILWLEGVNLMNLPLRERRKLLAHVLPAKGTLRVSENFEVSGTDFFALTSRMGLEGLIAKKTDSLYLPDQRSKDWLKIKTQKHQEAVIGGYTRNENSSRLFSALLMGIFKGGEFVFIGPVGTGYTTKMQKEILEKLKPLETPDCPFNEVPEYNKPSRFRPNPPKAEVVWVKPELVAEVTYRTVASDGSLRHPSFRGLREDKSPREVVRENPQDTSVVADKENALLKDRIISTPEHERKTLLNPSEETQVRTVGGHNLKFTNLSKIFWPEENISKRDVINYYYQVSPYMLPLIKDRPQTLNRFPNGIHAQSFYQKDVTGKVPGWIRTYQYFSETDQRLKNFLVCTEEASLLYIANLGCIEMNAWSSRAETPGNPDWCIIDLDPDKNTFEQVIDAAKMTKQVLDAIGAPSYCKTSGSTGLHIYIPLGAKYTYEDSKELGRAIVKVVHAQLPEFTSIERITAKRGGKMYLDFLQNRPQATVAAPYSLRPRPGATVSMPLHWDEVKYGLRITNFTIHNAIGKIKERGDIFKGVLGEGIDLLRAVEQLKKLLG